MIRMFLTLVVALVVATAAHAQAPAMQPPTPTPAQMKQAQQMMALMQEAIKPLTTADVENFLAAVTAFERAEWFPNPPHGVIDDDGNIHFNFAFYLTVGSRSPLNLFRF